MTREEIEKVQRSWAGLDGAALVERFYARLFAAEPELEAMFVGDPATLRRKFEATLSAIVGHLDDAERVTARVSALGALHAGYGVLPRHYALVEKALLETLAEVLGGEFDATVERAWRTAYRRLAEGMVDADHELLATDTR